MLCYAITFVLIFSDFIGQMNDTHWINCQWSWNVSLAPFLSFFLSCCAFMSSPYVWNVCVLCVVFCFLFLFISLLGCCRSVSFLFFCIDIFGVCFLFCFIGAMEETCLALTLFRPSTIRRTPVLHTYIRYNTMPLPLARENDHTRSARRCNITDW